MELRSCFDTIYLSSDAGICKPQPEFLKQVLDDYGLNPSETVMVGNDLTTDIAVAKAVGIDGILFNTFPYSRQELETSPIKPDRVITDYRGSKDSFYIKIHSIWQKSKTIIRIFGIIIPNFM